MRSADSQSLSWRNSAATRWPATRRSRRFRSRPAVAGFIAAATCHLNLLVTVAGEDRARETLRMAALDASLHNGVRRGTEPRQHIFYMSKNVGRCGTSSLTCVGRWQDRDGRFPLMNLQKCRQSADRL